MVGGLIAAGRSPVQIAGAVMAGGAACLGFALGQPVVAGARHRGLAARAERTGSRVPSDGEILALDGRPALAVMADELGDLFRHSGRRFAPKLWLAERSAGAGRVEGYADAPSWPRSTRRAAPCAWRAAGPGPSCA